MPLGNTHLPYLVLNVREYDKFVPQSIAIPQRKRDNLTAIVDVLSKAQQDIQHCSFQRVPGIVFESGWHRRETQATFLGVVVGYGFQNAGSQAGKAIEDICEYLRKYLRCQQRQN